MFTQSAPALVNALSGVLPPNAVQALTQALGNCNQPLTHRGAVNFSPPTVRESGPGYTNGGQWDPFQYPGLLPYADQANAVDIPGWESPGAWNSSNFYGDTFQFPTNQQFTTNQYLGGPNIYNAGNQYTSTLYTENHVSNNLSVNNINVSYINGEPVSGPSGPSGNDGLNGAPGAPGAPGQDGLVAFGGFFGGGRLKKNFRLLGPFLSGNPRVSLRGALRVTKATISIPTSFAIDPDTCAVSVSGTEEVDVVTQVQLRPTATIDGLQQAFFGPVLSDVALVP